MVVLDQGSRGPGTKMKWEEWSSGNCKSRSVRALNPSAIISVSA